MSRTLRNARDGTLLTIDQTLLPFERRELALRSVDDCVDAIRTMRVRGAPLIGAVGAWGMVFALDDDASDGNLRAVYTRLVEARPTAVNLRWALDRIVRRVASAASGARARLARDEATAICDEDVECNRKIGEHGARLLRGLAEQRSALAGMAGATSIPLNLLTHCNAGALATIAHGTALAPIYRMHSEGVALHVWVDETRPRNQGSAITAWELGERGVPHTVITDNAGGLLMMQGRVDAVIVGCDRVAANGDVANKIGTYLKALAARDNGVPFYVACPISTIDVDTKDGASIPIEERDESEVTHVRGRLDDGAQASVRVTPPASAAANPGFDITPSRLITALITETGVCDASPAAIVALLRNARNGESGEPR